jgi:hypothetical protein
VEVTEGLNMNKTRDRNEGGCERRVMVTYSLNMDNEMADNKRNRYVREEEEEEEEGGGGGGGGGRGAIIE